MTREIKTNGAKNNKKKKKKTVVQMALRELVSVANELRSGRLVAMKGFERLSEALKKLEDVPPSVELSLRLLRSWADVGQQNEKENAAKDTFFASVAAAEEAENLHQMLLKFRTDSSAIRDDKDTVLRVDDTGNSGPEIFEKVEDAASSSSLVVSSMTDLNDEQRRRDMQEITACAGDAAAHATTEMRRWYDFDAMHIGNADNYYKKCVRKVKLDLEIDRR